MRKLIYIMGCAHCGSTLLTTLLGRHSQISTVGELKLTGIPDKPDYPCGCGEPLDDCSFWAGVKSARSMVAKPLNLRDAGTHYSGGLGLTQRMVGTMVRGPFLEGLRKAGLTFWAPSQKILREITERNVALVDAVCEVEDKPVFLDGSKDPTRLMLLARSGKFDVRGIHLVRDGRAIVASYKKRNPDVDHCVNLWKTKATECDNLVTMPEFSNVMTLRYEDLCRDVASSLARIFAHAGVADESQACLETSGNASTHIIGHASRLGNAKEVTLREEWRKLLTPVDLEKFWRVEDGLNRKHGYLPEDGAAGEMAPARTGKAMEEHGVHS